MKSVDVHEGKKQLSMEVKSNKKMIEQEVKDAETEGESSSIRLTEEFAEEDNDPNNPLPLNIILFGPSGSGKSSLIKSFYFAVNQKSELPNDITKDLIIQKLHHNEGTQRLTRIPIKKSTSTVIETGKNVYRTTTTGVNCLDTRGQIYLSGCNIIEPILYSLKGKVKDMSLVEQRNFRYAYYLWEFWKKSSDLFDENIMRQTASLHSSSHAVIIVFDGSLDEIPNGEEETQFYRQIIGSLQSKGYYHPQIVMSRLDLVENRMKNMFSKHDGLTETEKQMRLSEVIDLKIEQVVNKLGVPRSSVHFIENYNVGSAAVDENINYYTLKLLQECLSQGSSFITHYLEEKRRNSSTLEKIKEIVSCSIF